jgi:Flp pilus assembly protein TadD
VQNNWDDKKTWFAGSPQSLAGDLIREGITGVAGHVSEPLLGHTIRPDILFPAYAAGFSLAEAFYLAMPSVSWMTVVVGDPLCAPFAKTPRDVEDPSIEPATELPKYFSARRLAALGGPKMPREAAEALLRAESRSARGNTAGARSDLERATTLVPELLPAQYALALMLEQAGADDDAIARYRTILKLKSDEWLALNNLAYLLSASTKDLAEALSLAERARQLAPSSGPVADTLGWVLHLTGDNPRALAMLKQAITEAPDVADIRVHLATVLAATGDVAGAKAEAAKAIELDPSLRERPDVVALVQPK